MKAKDINWFPFYEDEPYESEEFKKWKLFFDSRLVKNLDPPLSMYYGTTSNSGNIMDTTKFIKIFKTKMSDEKVG